MLTPSESYLLERVRERFFGESSRWDKSRAFMEKSNQYIYVLYLVESHRIRDK